MTAVQNDRQAEQEPRVALRLREIMKQVQTQRSSYLKDKKGTVAPLFGLMVIPMLAITGAAIDIGQAITAEKNMQNALDLRRLPFAAAAPVSRPPKRSCAPTWTQNFPEPD